MSKFKQNIYTHEGLFITKLTKTENDPYLLFIHGGPGMNSGTLEQFIIRDGIFDTLNTNIILYDQRGCGRSAKEAVVVTHKQNVQDLIDLLSYLNDHHDISPIALIGHSYGAKLLYDYYQSTRSQIPGIFLSTATTTITPRVKNLLLDINYLKRTDEKLYESSLKMFEEITEQTLWEITEKLAPYFFNNNERIFYYWANLDKMKRSQKIQNEIDLPINQNVFQSVRQDLYSPGANTSVDIEQLDHPTLWINGIQDIIMNSDETLSKSKVTIFQKSSHYPHIEESERFCEVINEFAANVRKT